MKVLVTGASQGIGKAIAEKFLQEGHQVCGMDIEESTIEESNYVHYICDVRDSQSFPDFAPEIIVNNAGVQESGADIDVNLKGAINVTEHYAFAACDGDSHDAAGSPDDATCDAAGGMKQPCNPLQRAPRPQVKAVVNIGSSSAHTGSEFPEYAASKGGLIAYTKNVALRLAPQATCNSIDPGGVLTDLNKPVMDKENLWNQIMELTPMKRWATPEEIAEWVYFVAVKNTFMTGQNLLIDGGEAGYNKFIWE